MKYLWMKTIIACILLGAVLLASGAVLVSHGVDLQISGKQKKMEETLGSLELPLLRLEEEELNSEQWFQENVDHSLLFSQSLLRELLTDGQYSGPRMFKDGMVIEIRDGKAIIPEEGFQHPIMTDDLIGMLQESNGEIVVSDSIIQEEISEEDADSILENHVLVGGISLDGPYYYLNWTSLLELVNYGSIHSRARNMLRETETAYGGALFVLGVSAWDEGSQDTSSFYLHSTSAVLPQVQEGTEHYDHLIKAFQNKDPMVTIDGEQYVLCSRWIDDGERVLVFLFPYQPIYIAVLIWCIGVLSLLLLVGITLIVYLYYIQKDALISQEENSRRYHPRKVLRRVMAAGLAGMLVLTAVAAFVQAVESLQIATFSGRETLEQLIEQVKTHLESASLETRQEEEEWYVYYGEEMAELFSQYPELATPDKLQELCDILQIDYIMLFDSRGKETVCNKDYSNFSLGTGQGENGSSFRRLLQGVDAIVQPVSYDETTSLTRQFIGVSLPDESNVDPQGALIMALFPDRTSRTMLDYTLNSQFQYLASSGTLYFGVDPQSGEILYSSHPEYQNNSIYRLGMGEQGLKGGYLGFAKIDNQGYYVLTAERDNLVYYCFVELSDLLFSVTSFSLVFLLCYLVLYVLLCLVMMAGFMKRSVMEEPGVEDPGEAAGNDRKIHLRHWNTSKIPWKQKSPREKAATVFQAALMILILLVCIYELTNVGKQLGNGESMFRFLFFGDWMRGINLFSVCAILLLIIGVFIITTLIKWFFRFFPLFLGNRGDTICKLLSSFANYISILVCIYFSLEFLGLRPSTILAGLGIVGLAITMGAKDMITDIFAGISLVFEGAFQAGDVIIIGNSQGKVESIGIRMTRIVDTSGNIRILNNKEIKDVINLTRMNSRAKAEIKVPSTVSFRKIREVMDRELPEIGKANPDIISGPFYSGITKTDEMTNRFIISISAECREENRFNVTCYLYESVVELLNKEGCLAKCDNSRTDKSN